MNCPNCNITLVISTRQEIEIDYCPQCRGIWLDRGELDKIIERSTFISRKSNDYDHDDDHEHKYEQGQPYKKRKKSFLGELFDIG